MGSTSYNTSERMTRSVDRGYFTKSIDEVFEQNKARKAHESMKSQGVTLREARDSDVHPNTVPIIFSLDVTGSMHHIPHQMIKDGLPNLISGLIQNGIPDPALLFLAVGDHECDQEPLQIAQFESGDAELDMWLERTYLEGRGGGNEGESYGLAMYFAARHCVTDAWEKRKEKGFLFIIGDEPGLENYPSRAMEEVMGNGDIKVFTNKEILAEAQEKWHVYFINPGHPNSRTNDYWGQLLHENFINLKSHTEVADVIKNIVCKVQGCGVKFEETQGQGNLDEDTDTILPLKPKKDEPKIML